jgi:hypothetical protein
MTVSDLSEQPCNKSDNAVKLVKPVFHSRISPPLAKNFAAEKVHLLFFRAVNEGSNRS